MRIIGVWSTEDNSLRKDIVSAFLALLLDPGDWRANFKWLNFSRINEMEASSLELPFSIEEVYATLCDMNGDKAPRLMVS